ncbi:hypothetical protein [Photobacterium salinisoli]|uniref:hypothetical protein n=1 Tax=Photobacterium salinisoli TaxID=1616783 RepID=UPI000EA01DB5|nr:hypothetical protein [Photobacterium salinisoli]
MPPFHYGIDVAKHCLSIYGEDHQGKMDICYKPWNHYKNIISGGCMSRLSPVIHLPLSDAHQ